MVATAGIPCRAASAIRSSIRAAPSSIEYSVCTCRWANEGPPEGAAEDGVELDGMGRV
ncbi:hypothetical protein GCM10023145_19310 [Angustibacter luteus]